MENTKITRRNEIINRRNAIIAAYEESRSLGGIPAETVQRLAEAIGAEEAERAVAELVRSVGDWDERVWDYVHAWADSVEGAASRVEQSDFRIYQPDEIHPVHINQLGEVYALAETRA